MIFFLRLFRELTLITANIMNIVLVWRKIWPAAKEEKPARSNDATGRQTIEVTD